MRAGIGQRKKREITFVDKRRDGVDRRLSIAGNIADLGIIDLLLLSIDIIWPRHIIQSRYSKNRYGVKRTTEGSHRDAGKGDQQPYNFLDHFTFPEILSVGIGFLDKVEIRFLLRYPMATHTDGVLRRAGQ